MQLLRTETDSPTGCVFRSHDQTCNFSRNRETDSHSGCVFRSHDQSCNFSGNTETDSPPGCVFRSHDQSCNFSGNTETDSLSGCVFRSPPDQSKKERNYLPPRSQSAFVPCITSFSYCFVLGMFLHLSVHKFQVCYHLHTIVNSLLILNCSQKTSSLTS